MDTILTSFQVGDAVITKLPELALDEMPASYLFPEADPTEAKRGGHALNAGSYDHTAEVFRLSVHAWIVRTPRHVVLVDTACGNGKPRPEMQAFDLLNQPFLENLTRAGVSPEEIDAVLLTHLHVDHVGWNTRKFDGRWVPTFKNAVHVFSEREKDYIASLSIGDRRHEAIRAAANLGPMAAEPYVGFWYDSVVPIIEQGLTREITVDGSEVLEGFTFLSTPGHSIDHASIGFASHGQQVLFWGDVMHNPVQFAHPEWNSVYCEFPEAARRSRRWAMELAASTRTLVLTTHFAESSAGYVSRDGERFAWRFA